MIAAYWAAKKLHMQPRTVRHWASTGVLPGKKTENGWLFDPDAVDAFRKNNPALLRPRQRAKGGSYALAA